MERLFNAYLWLCCTAVGWGEAPGGAEPLPYPFPVGRVDSNTGFNRLSRCELDVAEGATVFGA